MQVKVECVICDGRGKARKHFERCAQELEQQSGNTFFPGTLNLVAKNPLQLALEKGRLFDKEKRCLWPALLNGYKVYIYRYVGCPLHIFEIAADTNLRETLGVETGARVTLEVPAESVHMMKDMIVHQWNILWKGRETLYFQDTDDAKAIIKSAREANLVQTFKVVEAQ